MNWFDHTLTKAPITPKLVSLKYSKGLVLLTVCKKGYKKSGMCAFKNTERVSGWEATHWRRASALHTRLDWWAVSVGGFIAGYIFTISCRSAPIVPNECHSIGAKSGTISRFLLWKHIHVSVVINSKLPIICGGDVLGYHGKTHFVYNMQNCR